MMTRTVPTAIFLCLLCGQARAQQPAVVRKTTPGTIHGPSAPISGAGSIGGKAMLKPGQQGFFGGKISAPVGAHP